MTLKCFITKNTKIIYLISMCKRTICWYLIHSVDVPAASVGRRANVLHRRAEVGPVVGQVESGRQESWDKDLTDLEEHRG